MSGRPRIGVSRYVEPSASARAPIRRESSGPIVLVSRMSSPGAFGAISATTSSTAAAEGSDRSTVLHDCASSVSEPATRRPTADARLLAAGAASYTRTGRRVVSALAMGSPIAPRPTTPTVPGPCSCRFGHEPFAASMNRLVSKNSLGSTYFGTPPSSTYAFSASPTHFRTSPSS